MSTILQTSARVVVPGSEVRRIIVLAPPVPKARPRIGHGRVFTPRTTELAEHRIREAWTLEVGGEPLAGPVAFTVVAWLARPAGHFGKRGLRPAAPARPGVKPDLDNLCKTALDALNGVAWRDDGQVARLVAEKRYADDGPPRWEIEVEAL